MADDAYNTPVRVPHSPIPHPALDRARVREKLEKAADQMLAAAERILAALDAIDGDPDLEDDERETDTDPEPMLGRTERIDQTKADPGMEDYEPSLGAIERGYQNGGDQRSWCSGFTGGELDREMDAGDDREEVCEDEGAQVDAEPDDHHMCNWQDEGDQTALRNLPVFSKPRRRPRRHQNIEGYSPVKAL